MFEKTEHAIGGINVERQAAFLPMLQVIKMTPACIAHVRTSYHAPGNDRLGICPSSVAGRRTRRLGLRRLRCHGLPLSHPSVSHQVSIAPHAMPPAQPPVLQGLPRYER